jgi:hypothetical protein
MIGKLGEGQHQPKQRAIRTVSRAAMTNSHSFPDASQRRLLGSSVADKPFILLYIPA